MDTAELLTATQNAMSARRVFGEPLQVGDVTVVPAAAIAGGAGGGQHGSEDSGGGFGLRARPAGAYVVRGGEVSWRPAINVNLIIIGGQIVALAAILSARAVLLAWLRQRDQELVRARAL